MFREHGHVVALRFNSWTKEASALESICRRKIGNDHWDGSGAWTSRFGRAPNSNCSRPFWISFRNEADLTLVLLSADLTK